MFNKGAISHTLILSPDRPDGNNVLTGQFGVAIPLARGLPLSLYHILGVIGISPYNEVSRIATGWIIALVAYTQALWDRAVKYFINHPMNPDTPTLDSSFTVTLLAQCTCPQPAIPLWSESWGLINLTHQSIKALLRNHFALQNKTPLDAVAQCCHAKRTRQGVRVDNSTWALIEQLFSLRDKGIIPQNGEIIQIQRLA